MASEDRTAARVHVPRCWVKRWGVKLGPLHVAWLDLWSGSHGLEIAWGQHSVEVGFRGS